MAFETDFLQFIKRFCIMHVAAESNAPFGEREILNCANWKLSDARSRANAARDLFAFAYPSLIKAARCFALFSRDLRQRAKTPPAEDRK